MLEDSFDDVLKKAIRGLDLAPSLAAARAGLPVASVRELLQGRYAEKPARLLARALELDPDRLHALAQGWSPRPRSLREVIALRLPHPPEQPRMEVNAWIVLGREPGTALLFDTGTCAAPILDALRRAGRRPTAIFLTHGHRDHIGSLPELRAAFPEARVFADPAEDVPGASPIGPDMVWQLAGLEIESRRTAGHSPGGLSYAVRGGADGPLVVVGDACFAGSLGGVPASEYARAREQVRTLLQSLPPETPILPGHGPISSAGEELAGNPFLA